MQQGGLIPWNDFKPKLCRCCNGVRLMPTEEELEQRVTAQIDKESFERAILDAIDNKHKAVSE